MTKENEKRFMQKNKRSVGTAYEQIAGRVLEQQGYEILEYNYRCKTGEIDLIARDGEYLVFCEVKYRRTEDTGNPLEAVGIRKQRVIAKCAMYYLMDHPDLDDIPCRFDVVGILGDKVKVVKNAFECP